MGATLSDIHRRMYYRHREDGSDHEEALNKFPEPMRNQVEKELEMTDIESHYGMKDKWFWIGIGISIFVTVILVLILT